MSSGLALVDEESAGYYAGRPGSTIRRWAAEGRITRYPSAGRRVRYNVFELHKADRDEWTGELLAPGAVPSLPQAARVA